MNEYKSVTKFLSKNEEQKTFKSFIKNLFSKIFICLIILLVCLIVVKYDKNNKNLINSFLLIVINYQKKKRHYLVITLTCFLSFPNLSYLTTPSSFANSVWSFPIPTFVPG